MNLRQYSNSEKCQSNWVRICPTQNPNEFKCKDSINSAIRCKVSILVNPHLPLHKQDEQNPKRPIGTHNDVDHHHPTKSTEATALKTPSGGQMKHSSRQWRKADREHKHSLMISKNVSFPRVWNQEKRTFKTIAKTRQDTNITYCSDARWKPMEGRWGQNLLNRTHEVWLPSRAVCPH